MELIFVYNANSGLFSQAIDYVHKRLSPSTYNCKLCGLTYGALGEKKDWKEFIESLGIKSRFLHRDEFEREYPEKARDQFPAVYFKDNSAFYKIIDRSEIEEEENVGGLMELVNTKIERLI